MARPMDGVRVIEIAEYVYVPSAGAVLAEWGADVIKVERPAGGDPLRGWVRQGVVTGAAAQIITVEQSNRNKRSIGLDLSTPDGQAILLRLVDDADVFLTSLLTDTRRQLAIDVREIQERNPRVVYARGSAYGPLGSDSDRGGYDGTAYWFGGGFAQVLTPSGNPEPLQQRAGIGDSPSGAFLAGGVAAALFQRERTGIGPVVDGSLLGSAVWTLAADVLSSPYLEGDASPIPWTRVNAVNPTVNTYRTKDDRWFSLVMPRHDFFPALCAGLGRPDVRDDPRFATGESRYEYRVECIRALDIAFGELTLEECAALFDTTGATWSAMRTPLEIHDDPQARVNGYLTEIEHPDGSSFRVAGAPVQFDEALATLKAAPEYAQHTEEVLIDAGYSWDDIALFKERRVIP